MCTKKSHYLADKAKHFSALGHHRLWQITRSNHKSKCHGETSSRRPVNGRHTCKGYSRRIGETTRIQMTTMLNVSFDKVRVLCRREARPRKSCGIEMVRSRPVKPRRPSELLTTKSISLQVYLQECPISPSFVEFEGLRDSRLS